MLQDEGAINGGPTGDYKTNQEGGVQAASTHTTARQINSDASTSLCVLRWLH